MSFNDSRESSRREELNALICVGRYGPIHAAATIVAGVFVAMLEAVGLRFISSIVEIIQSTDALTAKPNGILPAFARVYEVTEILFTLGTVVLGASVILTVQRKSTSSGMWWKCAPFINSTMRVTDRNTTAPPFIPFTISRVAYSCLFIINRVLAYGKHNDINQAPLAYYR